MAEILTDKIIVRGNPIPGQKVHIDAMLESEETIETVITGDDWLVYENYSAPDEGLVIFYFHLDDDPSERRKTEVTITTDVGTYTIPVYNLPYTYTRTWEDFYIEPEMGTELKINKTNIAMSESETLVITTSYGKVNIAPIIRNNINGNNSDWLYATAFNSYSTSQSAKIFDVYYNGEIEYSIVAIYDYSYTDITPADKCFSIDNIVDNRMMLPCTEVEYFIMSIKNVKVKVNGINIYTGFFAIGNCTFAANIGEAPTYQNSTIEIGSRTFLTRDTCCDWALYYKNRYGGYDFLKIKGLVKRTDDTKRESYITSYDNHTIERKSIIYDANTAIKYRLSTDWLTDWQSEILAEHLLSSNDVYLHNLKENKIVPVKIDNANYEVQTFKGNSRKPVIYQINVTVDNDRINA